MNPKVSIIIPVYNVEPYIEKMLLSVKHQSLRDYEAIIVNDGSTDRSQEVIDEICKNDSRFQSLIQENGGVASARNRGLAMAAGEYVVFFDPDDFIPPKALAAMYRAAKDAEADIVIGVMQENRVGESRCNSHTIKLGKKKNIDKYDTELLWSFSVCNKMFRRSLLKENQISFPALKHAEDALFLFQCIFRARRISGCRKVVYAYQVRPFWESRSATQMVKASYLNDLIKGLDYLETIIEKQLSGETGDAKKRAAQLLQEFHVRYLHISILSGYYRQLWHMENEMPNVLQEKIASLREKLPASQWNRVILLNRDLQLEKGLYTKTAVTQEALLTFVIPQGIEKKDLQMLLDSIYDQCMPGFRVLLHEQYRKFVPEQFLNENLFFSSACNLAEVKTDFVMFADANILFSKNSIRMMVDTLMKNERADFVTAPLKVYADGTYRGTLQESAFTVMQCLKSKHNRYDLLDAIWGNKIFRTKSLQSLDVAGDKFYGSLLSFCSKLQGRKLYNAHMIATCDIRALDSGGKKRIPLVAARLKSVQKRLEDAIISYVKNRYTKEDVRKFIKKEI